MRWSIPPSYLPSCVYFCTRIWLKMIVVHSFKSRIKIPSWWQTALAWILRATGKEKKHILLKCISNVSALNMAWFSSPLSLCEPLPVKMYVVGHRGLYNPCEIISLLQKVDSLTPISVSFAFPMALGQWGRVFLLEGHLHPRITETKAGFSILIFSWKTLLLKSEDENSRWSL